MRSGKEIKLAGERLRDSNLKFPILSYLQMLGPLREVARGHGEPALVQDVLDGDSRGRNVSLQILLGFGQPLQIRDYQEETNTFGVSKVGKECE